MWQWNPRLVAILAALAAIAGFLAEGHGRGLSW